MKKLVFLALVSLLTSLTCGNVRAEQSAQAKTTENSNSRLQARCLTTCLRNPIEINECNTVEIIETYLRELTTEKTDKKN